MKISAARIFNIAADMNPELDEMVCGFRFEETERRPVIEAVSEGLNPILDSRRRERDKRTQREFITKKMRRR